MTIRENTRNLAANDTACSALTVTRIYLTLGRFDRSLGQRYNAHLGSPDGEKIVADALDAEYAACRALKRRGIRGRMETWWIGAAFPSALIADIEGAAQWTLRESAARSLSISRYRPLPHALRRLQEGSPAPRTGVRAKKKRATTMTGGFKKSHVSLPTIESPATRPAVEGR